MAPMQRGGCRALSLLLSLLVAFPSPTTAVATSASAASTVTVEKQLRAVSETLAKQKEALRQRAAQLLAREQADRQRSKALDVEASQLAKKEGDMQKVEQELVEEQHEFWVQQKHQANVGHAHRRVERREARRAPAQGPRGSPKKISLLALSDKTTRQTRSQAEVSVVSSAQQEQADAAAIAAAGGNAAAVAASGSHSGSDLGLVIAAGMVPAESLIPPSAEKAKQMGLIETGPTESGEEDSDPARQEDMQGENADNDDMLPAISGQAVPAEAR